MVRVYFNLHKKLFSIQEKIDGRWKVVRHAKRILLRDATFKVSQVGRERVLREKRKNVHAFIYGEPWNEIGPCCGEFKPVKYNPYLYSEFVLEGTGEPIKNTRLCYLTVNKNRAKIGVK